MKVSVWPEVVGILAAIGLGTVMLRGWPGTIVLTENMAAWVQAVGSIVAIVASALFAIGVRLAEDRSRQRLALSTSLDMIRACCSAAEDTFIAMNHIADEIEDRLTGGPVLPTERAEELRSTLRLLFGKDVPAAVLEHLLVIQRELAYTVSDIKLANLDPVFRSNDFEILRKAYKRPKVVRCAHEQLRQLRMEYLAESKKAESLLWWRFR